MQERPREPTDCRLGEVHMPLSVSLCVQGQALKTVARPQADDCFAHLIPQGSTARFNCQFTSFLTGDMTQS